MFYVDQREGDGDWITLGQFLCGSGTSCTVKISNSDTDGTVVADAISFKRKYSLAFDGRGRTGTQCDGSAFEDFDPPLANCFVQYGLDVDTAYDFKVSAMSYGIPTTNGLIAFDGFRSSDSVYRIPVGSRTLTDNKFTIETWARKSMAGRSSSAGVFKKFWWFTTGSEFPAQSDISVFGQDTDCEKTAAICFAKLPGHLHEDFTELLAIDNAGTRYQWSFNSQNSVAHAAWRAMKNGDEVTVQDGDVGIQRLSPVHLVQ
jgi:hypothetical protein